MLLWEPRGGDGTSLKGSTGNSSCVFPVPPIDREGGRDREHPFASALLHRHVKIYPPSLQLSTSTVFPRNGEI